MNTFKKFASALVILTLSFAANAQLKIAHLNTTEIMQKMDDYKIAELRLDSLSNAKKKEIAMYQDEFQRKQNEYIALNKATTSEATMKMKEKELTDMDTRIKDFAQDAQTELENFQVELIKPIQKKLQDALEAVAKEKGYAYVLDDQALLVKPAADDISNAVRLKLGIPVETTTPTPAPAPKK